MPEGGVDVWLAVYHHHSLPLGRHRFDSPVVAYILEMRPNDPFVMCREPFEAILCPDPTMQHPSPRVVPCGRPLPHPVVPYTHPSQSEIEHPVVGMFGFMTQGKQWDGLARAILDEFDTATLRLRLPIATYVPAGQDYIELIRRNITSLSSRLELEIEQQYCSQAELVEWCRGNTLNAFLYDRDMPGLSAVPDQAVAAGRPIAVSTNETFRHVHPYVHPYGQQTLRGCIEQSQIGVPLMQRDWADKEIQRALLRAVKIASPTLMLNTKI